MLTRRFQILLAQLLLLGFGVLLLLALAPAPARAYVLPAEAILSSIARRRAQLSFKSLILEGSHRRGKGAEGPDESVYEAIRPNHAHRVETKSAEGTTVVLTAGQKRWHFKEGERPGAPAKIKAEVVSTWLTSTEEDPGGRRGMAFLSAHGIDDNVVSLSRLGRRIAYVIGAKPLDLTKPQLWVDKSLRLPVRLIEIDPKTKSVTDTRYLDFGSGQTGEWYPRRIEVYQDNVLIEATTYTQARVNESIDEALFKAPAS